MRHGEEGMNTRVSTLKEKCDQSNWTENNWLTLQLGKLEMI